jgi:hypothetical protein
MRKIVLSLALLAGLVAALVAPPAALAQGGPGFLFDRPRVSLGIRTGYILPTISSPLFDDARQWYNLNRFDFDAPYLGGEIAARVSERWDVALGGGWSRAASRSHYRQFVEEVGGTPVEIEQENRFQTVSATLGARYYLSDRGRRIGRFAWVPSAITPFVGAGAGVTWYELEQVGDFVDQADPACPDACPIYTDLLRTDGSGATLYAGLGADVSLGKQVYLSAEGRYSLGNAGVSGQYAAYDDIDLSRLQLIAGISLRW